MNPSDSAIPHAGVDYAQEIDGALAALAAVRPRDGLEQRVLARIASAPELPWYRRLMAASTGHHRWALAAASAVIVAGGVSMTAYHYHPAAGTTLTPVALHTPHPARQPAAAAASIGVSSQPLQMNKAKARHRGVHKSYRAVHDRVPLPRGTAAPMRPRITPVTQ